MNPIRFTLKQKAIMITLYKDPNSYIKEMFQVGEGVVGSDDAVFLESSTGGSETVYFPTLNFLEEQGLISCEAPVEDGEGWFHNIYKLTDFGIEQAKWIKAGCPSRKVAKNKGKKKAIKKNA